MKTLSIGFVVVVMAVASSAFGQYYYGGDNGRTPLVTRATTPMESYYKGYANVLRSRGLLELDRSKAAINWTEAHRRAIENRKQFVETYFDVRRQSRYMRMAERGSRLATEDINRIAKEASPERLGPNELDTLTGAVRWPVMLRLAPFADERAYLEELLAQRAVSRVQDPENTLKIIKTTGHMREGLKDQIGELPPGEYLAARKFLDSLEFEASQPVSSQAALAMWQR